MVGATTDLKIYYIETPMTTTMPMAFDDLINLDLIMNYGVRHAWRRLKLLSNEAKCDGIASIAIKRPTKAKNYRSEFFIALSLEYLYKGFHE